MGKKRFLKTFTSTALACVLTASSLIGVFAAEGTRTISRSTVEWAKDISYNYPKGTQTVQYSEGLQFAMHYFKSNDESGDLISPNHLAFCIEPEKGVEIYSSGDIITKDASVPMALRTKVCWSRSLSAFWKKAAALKTQNIRSFRGTAE